MERPSSTGDFACTSATLAGSTHDDELPSERRVDRLSCRPPMRPILLFLVLALVGCSGSSDPGDAKVPITLENPKSDPKDPSGSDAKDDPKVPTSSGDPKENPAQAPPSGINFGCRLPAPVRSDDACTKDAECAPAVPCHARACVAVGKATPRTPDTVCTMNIDCQSADVNPCSCYEGRCTLVPANP